MFYEVFYYDEKIYVQRPMAILITNAVTSPYDGIKNGKNIN
ncbi:MAG: hypothetical protein Q4A45_01320 [Clostridia bacterium]|nr:hypothetical protein [Clostridia bacterium]